MERKMIDMEKNRGYRSLIVLSLVLAITGISVAFAALSQTLTITGTAAVKGSTWNISFANLSTPTIVGNALINEDAELDSNSTTLTFDVLLHHPGDKVTYTFDVVNNGTLDAKVSSVNLTGVAEALAKNINYNLTYEDGSTIQANDLLNSREIKKLKLIVEFNSGATTVSEEDINLDLGATIIYIQQ